MTAAWKEWTSAESAMEKAKERFYAFQKVLDNLPLEQIVTQVAGETPAKE
jgi:hypothetical protein